MAEKIAKRSHTGKRQGMLGRVTGPVTKAHTIGRLRAEYDLQLNDKMLASFKQMTLDWAEIADSQRLVRQAIQALATAQRRAQRFGHPVSVTFKVPPRGARSSGVTVREPASSGLADALKAARERGAASVATIMKQPDMLSGREMAERIGASPETVNQKRKVGELLGVEGATRGVRYPAWQLTPDGRLLPGLSSIFELLDRDSWKVFRFLLQRHNELAGRTAVDTMKAGELQAVEGVARNVQTGVFA